LTFQEPLRSKFTLDLGAPVVKELAPKELKAEVIGASKFSKAKAIKKSMTTMVSVKDKYKLEVEPKKA